MLHAAFAIIHLLAAAAWFGAMCYSAFVLHPRAREFFPGDGDFEAFITTVSHGARWKMIALLALIGLTGAGLALASGPRSVAWWVVAGSKTAILLCALGLFVCVSWRLWPARVLAAPSEIPRFQRRFRRVAWTMIFLAATALALGAVAQRL